MRAKACCGSKGLFGKRNTDGGPNTHLFAFDLEREREIATTTTHPTKQDLLSARLRLVDEVAQYRRTGRLADELLLACDNELKLSDPLHSKGLRRLCELSADGHDEAKERIRRLFHHPRGEVRAALIWGFGPLALGSKEAVDQARRLLRDRSRYVRHVAAQAAVFSHWPELVGDLLEAALCAKTEAEARSIHFYAYHLQKNERTGHRGGMKSEVEDLPNEDGAQAGFLDAWRARGAAGA